MPNFLIKALGLIVALALSGAAYAVGMGGNQRVNRTGRAFKPLRLNWLRSAKLKEAKYPHSWPRPDAFKGAGLEYPATLPKLNFQIDTRANGDPYLKVTTDQAVNEPFVSILVELTWPSGQLLREYTFLLDPPGFKT
ncbi:MAG: hypothetical protein WDM70_07490 [Nitrosomonadales bacterium]